VTDFLRLLLEIIQYIWPFRIVWQWEQGCLYICGRYRKTVGPGIYPVIPYFMEVKTDSVVQDPVQTPLQTITLKAGGTLTFSAVVTLEIIDLGKAYNLVVTYENSSLELASAILAEKLTEVEEEQFGPEKRGRLVGACRQALNAKLGEFGVRATELRFNNFVRNMRAYRLLNDQLIGGRP
jgi:regulator of protease activity HflC (stomatin/prohibitin superfamily)